LTGIILTFLCLFVNLSFAQDLKWISINDFSGGLNDDVSTWELADNEATDLLNVYVDEIEKGISKRKGYQKANSTTTTSNSWLQDTAEDWNAGTLVNIDTYTASGTFRIAKTTEAINQQQPDPKSSGSYTYAGPLGQSFELQEEGTCTKIALYLYRYSSVSEDFTIHIATDDNNSPVGSLVSLSVSSSTISATGAWHIFDIDDIDLLADTRYWIYIPKIGGNVGESYNLYNTCPDGSLYPYGNYWENGTHYTTTDLAFKIYVKAYFPSGSFISQSYDCGSDIQQWGRLEANDTLNGQTITYAVRTSSYSGGLAIADWYEVQSGNNITAPVNQYVQGISTLTSTGSQTPIVNNVTIYWYSTPASVFDYPITSLHRLKKSDGSEYMWAVSSGTIWGSDDAGTFSSVKSGMSTTYDVNWANIGDTAYCVDGSTWAQKFTAYDSCTAVTTVPRGRFIIEEGYRLWVGYASGYPNRLYYSDLADDTTWDWVYIPGEGEITGLGKLQGSPIVYKTNSAWKVVGTQVTTEEDVYFVPSLVNLSSEIGCINHRAIQNFRLKGMTVQVFLGKDNVYATNGVAVTPVGDKIGNTIEDLKQASFASSYSWNETLFTEGTSVNVDTTTVPCTIRLDSDYWIETSTTDFGAGVTKTNIDTSNDEIKLILSDEAIDQQQTTWIGNWGLIPDRAQSFKPSQNCFITKISIYVGGNGNYTLRLKSDNNNSPGITLQTKTISVTSWGWEDFDITDQAVNGGVRYWIWLDKMTDSQNWSYATGNPYSNGNAWNSIGGHTTSYDHLFKVYEKHYPASGYFRSQEKDLSITSAFGNFHEDDTGSGITYKVRRYVDGDWSSFVTVTDGNKINLTPGTKVQYDITLTGTGNATPTIYDVSVDYVTQDGNFTSQYHDCGTQITNWGNFVPNHTLNGQIISYQVRSSTWSGAIDGTSWYDVVPSGLIPCLVNRYVQWKSIFNTTDGTKNPTLEDVAIYWWAGAFSGSSPASVVYDDRYHLFAMTSGSDVNDIDLVLNEDGAWTKNDIGADSAVIYNEKLYTGSSTTTANGSWLYEQDIGYSDDLQPINSYWQSKDYDLGIPYKDKTLRKIWTVAKKVGAYPLKLEYITDFGNTLNSYNVWLSSGVAIATDERHISSEARGKFFRFKVSNNGENQPFELYRIDCGFQPSPGGSEP